MSEFVFPFEYLSISKALPILNRHSQSFEITHDLILQWWRDGVINLYFVSDEIKASFGKLGIEADLGTTDILTIHRYNTMEWQKVEGEIVPTFAFGDNGPLPDELTLHPEAETEDEDDTPIFVSMPEHVIIKGDAQKILALAQGVQTEQTRSTNVTAKQCRFIVELLRVHGLTDEDFKGSIPQLRQKIARLKIAETYGDDKTLTDWLVKAGVR